MRGENSRESRAEQQQILEILQEQRTLWWVLRSSLGSLFIDRTQQVDLQFHAGVLRFLVYYWMLSGVHVCECKRS